MKAIVIGLGVQGQKRKKTLQKKGFYVCSVDPLNKEAEEKKISQIEKYKYDTVFICVPDKEKEKYKDIFINKKINIFIEKPFLVNDEKMKKYEKISNINKKYFYIAYNHRFEPHLMKVKKILFDKNIGDIYYLNIFYGNGTAKLVKNSWRNKNFLLLGDTHTDLRESETCSNSIDIVNYIDNIINLNKGIKCIDFFLETSNIGRLLENPSLRSDLIKSVKNSNQNMAMGKLRNYFLTKNKLMDDTEENEYFRFHDIDIRYYFPYNGILHSENNSLLQIIKFFNILKKDKNTGLSVLITYINKIFDYFIENDQHTINPDKSLIKDEDEKYIIDLINKQKNKCDLNIKSKIIEYTKLYLSDKIYNRLKNINENTLKIIVSDLKARIMDVYSLFRMFRKSDLDRDLKRVIKGCLIDKYNNIICYSGEDHNKFYINFLLSINAELIIQKNISNRSDPTKRCINIGKFIPFNN